MAANLQQLYSLSGSVAINGGAVRMARAVFYKI